MKDRKWCCPSECLCDGSFYCIWTNGFRGKPLYNAKIIIWKYRWFCIFLLKHAYYAMKLYRQSDQIGLEMTVLHVPYIKNNKTKIVLPSLLKWKLWTKGNKQLWKYTVWSFGELKSVNYSLKHIFWNGELQVSYCKRTNNSEIQIKIVCCNRRIKIKQQNLFQSLRHCWNSLKQVFNKTKVWNLENRSISIFVDGYNGLAVFHSS